MRVINNRGKIGKSPRESNKERQREMKEIADMKGLVGIAIKIATLCLVEIFRIRDISGANIHSLNYVGHSLVERWAKCLNSGT